MNYSNDFQNVVKYCATEKTFLGYGNPDAKVLIVGKEQALRESIRPENPDFYNVITRQQSLDNDTNISLWEKNISEYIKPEWDNIPNGSSEPLNPLYSHGAQRNIRNNNRNGGTSDTYLKYQKLYQLLFNGGEKSDLLSFQKDFFITELSDIPTKQSYRDPKLNQLRKEAVQKRINLFKQPFFSNFPVVIIAAGHYPKLYGFDMEAIFNVKYEPSKNPNLEKYRGNWCNVHYGYKDEKILLHTRQLSQNVCNSLLSEMKNLIQPFI